MWFLLVNAYPCQQSLLMAGIHFLAIAYCFSSLQSTESSQFSGLLMKYHKQRVVMVAAFKCMSYFLSEIHRISPLRASGNPSRHYLNLQLFRNDSRCTSSTEYRLPVMDLVHVALLFQKSSAQLMIIGVCGWSGPIWTSQQKRKLSHQTMMILEPSLMHFDRKLDLFSRDLSFFLLVDQHSLILADCNNWHAHQW